MSSPARRALITGVSGQDGGYLSELLLAHGYEVFGLLRPAESPEHLPAGVVGLTGDLGELGSLRDALESVRPAEVYNLAAATSVGDSFSDPLGTCDITAIGVLRVLEAIRSVDGGIRLLQPSSAEIFGAATQCPQVETTPLAPRSPYGVAKAFAHMMVQTYRESYGLFACNAILYNHESPRRGTQFVTRKITAGAARIAAGLATELRLGNTAVSRDWGFAGDYVRAMHLMLQQGSAGDYVVATGELHTIEEFLGLAFGHLGLDWRDHVVVDQSLFRPTEPARLCGDAAWARERLGWEPSISFAELVTLMVDADRQRLDVVSAEVSTS